MASLSLRHLSKTYDNGVNAIRDFTLEVDDKEFMIFAGPVGCGISTVLRMIAGVEDITDGELLVDGERMNEVPSIDRNMAMIFKNGKLYPQMNIYDNLAFGLKLKELPKGEIDARIAEVTEVLKIGHLLDKMTEDLDEQERALVVLGRAMVKKPKVFLLDEPFSNLSKDVKRHMQKLVRKLYDQMHITVIYVTHNREDIQNTDARIAVMNDGSIQQIGTIGELYDNPATPYVSEFLGVAAQVIVDMLNTEAMTKVHVAFGTIVNEIKEVSRSYKEAKMAMDVGKIFYPDKNVIAYSRLGIGRLIYQLPLPLCKMFIKEIFDGRSPDEFDEETLQTINKFFENNLNVSETSRQLYIHRNTLVYRLDKLQKSTGLDLRVFEDAITFKIALMVVKYMKYMESIEY